MKKILSFILIFIILISSVNISFAKELTFESFETDISTLFTKGWGYSSAASSSYVSIGNVARSGSKSLKVVDASTSGAYGVKYESASVVPGTTVSSSVYAYALSGRLDFYFQFYDGSGNRLYSKTNSTSKTKEWELLSWSYIVPDNAAKVRLCLCTTSTSLGEGYYDDFSLSVTDSVLMPVQANPVKSALITPTDNKLTYSAYNEYGDKLSDFSYAGYYGGDKELPLSDSIETYITLEPDENSTDDITRINSAISSASSLYLKDGKMRKVKLKAGKYKVGSDGIKMKSGVLLSGEGQSPNGTIIYAYDPIQYSAIKITGTAYSKIGSPVYITDDYVKAGSYSVNVSPDMISGLKVGDSVLIYHPATKEWASALGMLALENTSGNITTWNSSGVDMVKERLITSISGTKVTFDLPVYVPLIKAYTQSYLIKLKDTARVVDFGVENLRVESYFDKNDRNNEDHSWSGIDIRNAKNGFVRDVSTKYFGLSAIRCSDKVSKVTIQNCSSLEPVSKVQGSRRYSFAVAKHSQQVLVTGCYSYDGRHDYETSFTVTGPIVFSDNVTEASTNVTEPHGTWSTGVLFDNIYHIGGKTLGYIGLTNRGVYGSSYSQGWTSATGIVWNSLAPAIMGHKPYLSYQNFLIGIYGIYNDSSINTRKSSLISTYKTLYRTDTQLSGNNSNFVTDNNTPFIGDCYMEAKYNPVEPANLYKAQLSERIIGDYRFSKPNAPIIYSPSPESEFKGNSISIYGSMKKGADGVNVYIDDVLYEAEINEENNTFSVSASLADGYHKIYATQIINGVEGTKNADRFIKIGNTNSTANPIYLQSIYDTSKTELINRMNVSEYVIDKDVYYKGKFYNAPCVILSGKTANLKDATIKESEILISETKEFAKSKKMKYNSISNPAVMISGLEKGKVYYSKMYTTYTLKDKKEYTVTGEVSEFKL